MVKQAMVWNGIILLNKDPQISLNLELKGFIILTI